MDVTLDDLEPVDTGAQKMGAAHTVTMDDLEAVDAPNNSVYHEPSDRVLSLPQTLDAKEAQYTIDKEIDGKKDFFAMEPRTPEEAMGQMYEAVGRRLAGMVTSLPGELAGISIRQSQIAQDRIKSGKTVESFNAGLFGAPKLFRDLVFGSQEVLDAATRIKERNDRWLKEAGLRETPGNSAARFVSDATGALGQAGAAVFLRMPKLVVLAQSAFQQSDSYQDAIKRGFPVEDAATYSDQQFAWNAATEAVGTTFLFKSIAEDTVGKAFTKAFLSESSQEGTQNIGQDLISNDWSVTDKSTKDILTDAAYSALLGGISGGPVSGVGAAFRIEAENRGINTKLAGLLQKHFEEQLVDMPSIMSDFLDREVRPIADKDHDAKTFLQVMDSSGNDPKNVDFESLSEGDKLIFDQFLKVFNESARNPQGVHAVEKAFYDKGIAAGLDQQQAIASSKLLGMRSEAASRALGITPMEWFKSWNLDLEVQRTKEEAIQSYADQLNLLNEQDVQAPPVKAPEEPLTPEEQAAKAQEVASYQERLNAANAGTKDVSVKKPIIQYIKSLGGIHPDGLIAQELRHVGINSKTAPGLYHRKEDALRDFDNIPTEEFNRALGTSAQDDGNGYVDRDWLIQALRDEQFGTRIGQEKPVGDESFIQALDKVGLDYRTATAEQVYEKLGADADIVIAAADMGMELTPKEVRQVRGILDSNSDMDIVDAIDRLVERQSIEKFYQAVDKTAAGDQNVLPGAERISDKQLAERKMQAPMKGKKPQQAMDIGLFGDETKQQTLFQRIGFSERVTGMIRDTLAGMVSDNSNVKDPADFMSRAERGEITMTERRMLPRDLLRLADSLRERSMETQRLYQTANQEGARGAITFGKDRTLIQLFQDANPSTLLHELGHLFLRDMIRVASQSRRPMVRKDLDTIKKWVGAKGDKFTEAQEEKFARGFEAYLREGKAPQPGLQAVFDKFKQWLTSIYKSMKDLDVNINDDVRQVFDRMLGADYARTEEQMKQRDLAKLEADYKAVEEQDLTDFWGDAGAVMKSGKQLAANMFSPVSSRLGRIDPTLKAVLRRFNFEMGLNENRDRQRVLGFLEGLEKMSEADYKRIDFAMKNRDEATVNDIAAKYGVAEHIKEVRALLDDIYNEALDVGLDVAYLENYFPRMVRIGKSSEYMAALRGRADWSLIEEALKEADPLNVFTDEEKAVFVNKWLRGHAPNATLIALPSFVKERVVDYVEPQWNQYYLESGEALLKYISAMRLGIAQKKIFGKGGNTEESVGAYVLNLVQQKAISADQEQEVKMLFNAALNSKGPGVFVSWLKNAGYVYLMGSPISAITQIGDLAFALAKNGYYRTGVSLAKALVGKSILKKEDLGIANIAQEFEDNSRAGNAVRTVFKAIGLEWIDNIGKQVYIESAHKRLQAEAKKNGAGFKKSMQEIFGEEADSVRADLLNGTISDNVKLLLFSELSDVQPVSLAEMPVGYLKGGNLRALYMLKTYTVKQIDTYRREIFDKMASGKSQEVRQGTEMLVRLTVALMLTGMGADALKDLLLGRAITLSELVMDNVLKLAGLTKFQIYQSRQDGVGNTIMQMFFVPPLYAPFDNLIKDVQRISSGKMEPKDALSFSYVPIVGKFYYWWVGGGRTKEEKKRQRNG